MNLLDYYLSRQGNLGTVMALCRDIMHKPAIYYVYSGDSVDEVKHTLSRHNIHGLLVVSKADNSIQGIITSTDLLTKPYNSGTSAAELCSSVTHTIDKNSCVEEAAVLMSEKGIHHLLVVDDQRPVGMLSSLDIVKALSVDKVGC